MSIEEVSWVTQILKDIQTMVYLLEYSSMEAPHSKSLLYELGEISPVRKIALRDAQFNGWISNILLATETGQKGDSKEI